MRQRTLIPVVAVLALFLGACNQDRGRALAYKQVEAQALEAEVLALEQDLAEAHARIAELETRPVADTSDEARRALEGSGAEVEWRRGELVITLTNDILFSPGSATLTDQARQSLAQVADLIRRDYGAQYLRIEGHTDSDPIRQSRDKWEDNWHLAGARARSVLHNLIERGGIDRQQVSFAGYADTQPRASNDSRAGKARNRRVAIVVLPRSR